jgi:ketosteroid isomerase-like protein
MKKLLMIALGLLALAITNVRPINANEEKTVIPPALKQAISRQHDALSAFVTGNVAPWIEICSHAEDATIIGGWGGHEKGWSTQVKARYEWAAARFKGAEGEVKVENLSLVVTPDLAYSVDIERSRVRLQGSDEFAPMALRVTTIYRREKDDWKMVHRHADPLLEIKPANSVVQK